MNQHDVQTVRSSASLPEGAAHPYTPGRDGPEAPMSGGEAARSAPAGGRHRDALTRADRIVVTMLAALLGGTLVGFVAIGGQLVGLQRQIGDLRTEMHSEIGTLRTEMHREIGTLRTEMRSEIGELRTEMRSEFSKVSDRITRLETGPSASRPGSAASNR